MDENTLMTEGSPLPILRVLLLGEPAVGKTSLVRRYLQDVFVSRYSPTVGLNFKVRTKERKCLVLTCVKRLWLNCMKLNKYGVDNG